MLLTNVSVLVPLLFAIATDPGCSRCHPHYPAVFPDARFWLRALTQVITATPGGAVQKNMGAIMKAATAKAAGRADSKTLSALIKSKLK